MLRFTQMLEMLFAILILAGCEISADPNLPYQELPYIEVGMAFQPVAMPSHSAAYLSSDKIAAGTEVQVIAADRDRAWLLISDEGRLGWMPSIYSRNNIGAAPVPLIIEPLPADCTNYLGTTSNFKKKWISPYAGSKIVLGSIYRSAPQPEFAQASLALEIYGDATVSRSDFVHLPLTENTAIVLFGFRVANLEEGDALGFVLEDAGGEPLALQAVFFGDECPDNGPATRLEIGETRRPLADIAYLDESGQDEATPPVSDGNGGDGSDSNNNEATATPVVVTPNTENSVQREQTAFAVNRGGDIFLWSVDEGTEEPLIIESSNDHLLAWSPDGQQFVFNSDRSGVEQLYIFDIPKHRTISQITDSITSKPFAAWSPDGSRIVYQELLGDTYQLVLLDLKSEESQQLTSAGISKTPRWDLGGDLLVFSGAREDTRGDALFDTPDNIVDDKDSRHIFIMDVDTHEVTPVTTALEQYDFLPYWMPEGEQIVFIRKASPDSSTFGAGEVAMVNVETKDLTILTFTSEDELYAKPSLSGDQFLIGRVQNDRSGVYLADWDGTELGDPYFVTEGDSAEWRPSGNE